MLSAEEASRGRARFATDDCDVAAVPPLSAEFALLPSAGVGVDDEALGSGAGASVASVGALARVVESEIGAFGLKRAFHIPVATTASPSMAVATSSERRLGTAESAGGRVAGAAADSVPASSAVTVAAVAFGFGSEASIARSCRVETASTRLSARRPRSLA